MFNNLRRAIARMIWSEPEKATAFKVGAEVYVYDRYRFASHPVVRGVIVELSSIAGGGAKVSVSGSENPAARSLGTVWVSFGQLRHIRKVERYEI